MLELITFNLRLGKADRVVKDGQAWWVIPAVSMIGDGVMNGSKGALFYPTEHQVSSTAAWNGKPITLRHPTDPMTGSHLSAADAPHQWLGNVRDSQHDGKKLRHKLWFNENALEERAPNVLHNLKAGIPIELSTGLYTSNEERPGVNKAGKPYTHVASQYRPDHIAVLPDELGACSVHDGCGVGVVNELTVNERQVLGFNVWSDEARKASAEARKSGKPADHLKAAKLHLRDSRDSGDESHKAAMTHIDAAAKLTGNTWSPAQAKADKAKTAKQPKQPKGQQPTTPSVQPSPVATPKPSAVQAPSQPSEPSEPSQPSQPALPEGKVRGIHGAIHDTPASNHTQEPLVNVKERVSLWRSIGQMLGLTSNRGFTDDAAATLTGTKKTRQERKVIGAVDEDDDQETDQAGDEDDHDNPPDNPFKEPPANNKKKCKECGGDLDEDGYCEECDEVENSSDCPKCKGKMTDNKCTCSGAKTMNAAQIEKLMELPFIIQGMTTNAGRTQFSKFITTNMPAGGAFEGAKSSGYSPAQAAAMAGKLEGSYEEQSKDHHMAGRAAEKASEHANKTKSKSAHKKAAAAHKEASKAHGDAGNADSAKYHATQSRSHSQKAARMARNELSINQLVSNGFLDRSAAETALLILNKKSEANFSDETDEDDTTKESDDADEESVVAGEGANTTYEDKAEKQVTSKSPKTMNTAVANERQWLESAPSYIRDQVVNRRKQIIEQLTCNASEDDKPILKRDYAAMTTDRLELYARNQPVANQQTDHLAGVFNREGLENQFPMVNRVTANLDQLERGQSQPPVYGGFNGGSSQLPVANQFNDAGYEPPSLIELIKAEK